MRKKRVLLAPLDWGLGHATRCIPIINLLVEFNCDVTIAGSGASLALLKFEYPALTFVELPAYCPVYSSYNSLVGAMIRQIPKFLVVIKKEHNVLEEIVRDKNIEIVISDNRYGCWSSAAKSIFITHQLNILMPTGLGWLSPLINYFNYKLISKYDVCWVPDYVDGNFTAALSKSARVTPKFIGILSRFEKCLPVTVFKYQLIIVLSGPEPQRTLLEEILLRQLEQMNYRTLVVRGVSGTAGYKISDDIDVIDFLNSEQLNKAICESEIVVARSGYSTIMDLSRLEKRALLIPTPGQTEQKYLAGILRKKLVAYSVAQNKIDLKSDIKEAYRFNGFKSLAKNQDSLKIIISELVK
jgi:uncharacterized protein (TIGR00661 family)